MMTFVGVCGGRDFADAEWVDLVLRAVVNARDAIVHGDARGLDKLADAWALEHGNHVVRIPALWKSFAKSAGPRRNRVIAAMPLRMLVVFPGGSGTNDMVNRATEAQVNVTWATDFLPKVPLT